MKNKFKMFCSILLIIIIMPLNIREVSASGSASIVVSPRTVHPGESFKVTVSYNSSTNTTFNFWVNSSNKGVSSLNQQLFNAGSGPTPTGVKNGSYTFDLTAGSVGETTFSIVSNDSVSVETLESVNLSASATLSVIPKPEPSKPAPKPEPSKPAPKPSTPGNSGNSGNTGNSGNVTEKPVEKTPQQIEEEKKAEAEKVEAEKKTEEEKKKEKENKTPLIENIDIISDSENMHGLALETLKTEADRFSYEYTLPKNIDAFKLSFDKASDDVVLDYKESHEFSDEQSSISVPVKATKGDITQDYTIVVKKNDAPVIKRSLNDKEVTVLDDDALIAYMDKLGFKTETYDADGKEGYYFKKGDVKLQLLMDDEFKGVWYLLDSNNNLDKEVIALEVKDDLFFVTEAPTELQKETLNGEKYSEKSHDFLPVYKDFHPSLTMSSKYKAWDTKDGQIVYGFTSDKEEGLYFKNNTTDEEVISMEKAYVGFDQVDGKVKNIAIGSSVALLGLIPTNIIYYVINKKKENELV